MEAWGQQSAEVSCSQCAIVLQVAIAYTLLTAVFLFAFYVSPNISWLQWLLVAGVGFSLYGPQMLIGLCGAEAVAKDAVSACQGFLGIISYAGKPLMLTVPPTSGSCALSWALQAFVECDKAL